MEALARNELTKQFGDHSRKAAILSVLYLEIS